MRYRVSGTIQVAPRVFFIVLILIFLTGSPAFGVIQHFTGSTTSFYSASYYGHLHIGSVDAAIGDEVGVFDPDGVLCGATEAREPAWHSITVYGDDPSTPDVDEGASPGDLLVFRVWDKSHGRELTATATVTDGPCTNPLRWYNSGDWCQVDVTATTRSLTRINLWSPKNRRTLSSPPIFMCNPNGGTRNAYVVDLHVPGLVSIWTTPVQNVNTWEMPDNIWNMIPVGSTVYWRYRGADLNDPPLNIITSNEVWWFIKQ